MTREAYIEELRARIAHLPREEREAALRYYIEYLEDATDKTMEQIIEELGTPQQVAERIIAECAQSEQRSNSSQNVGCIAGAIAVLTSPIWLPVLFAILLVGAVLLFVAVLVVFILGVVALALLAAGFWALTVYPPTGLAVLGGSLICLGLTVLFALLCMVGFSTMKSLVAGYRSRRQQ